MIKVFTKNSKSNLIRKCFLNLIKLFLTVYDTDDNDGLQQRILQFSQTRTLPGPKNLQPLHLCSIWTTIAVNKPEFIRKMLVSPSTHSSAFRYCLLQLLKNLKPLTWSRFTLCSKFTTKEKQINPVCKWLNKRLKCRHSLIIRLLLVAAAR